MTGALYYGPATEDWTYGVPSTEFRGGHRQQVASYGWSRARRARQDNPPSYADHLPAGLLRDIHLYQKAFLLR